MSSVSSVTSATSPYAAATDATTSTATATTGTQTLGQNDFLKLLSVQFQNQDPMKPMDDTAFIAQMAQFTALSQTQTLTTQMAKLTTSQGLVAANSYIGQQVTVDNGQGGTASGIVSGVQVDPTNGPQIMVGGTPYSITSVLSVQPGTAATSVTPPTSSTAGGS